jgi:hypothetical protein
MYLNNSQALGATSNSYTATGLSPGKAYEFAVGAFNSVNDPNPIWAVQTATTPAAQPSTTTPTAPAGAPIPLTVTATGATFINLSWKPVAGVDGYDLYVSSNGTGWQHFSLPANWGSVSVTGLTPGTTYTFALRAHYSSGFNSASAVDAALYDGDDE